MNTNPIHLHFEAFNTHAQCPGCQKKIRFYDLHLLVNVHSIRHINVAKELDNYRCIGLFYGCDNPLCEWSKVDGYGDNK